MPWSIRRPLPKHVDGAGSTSNYRYMTDFDRRRSNSTMYVDETLAVPLKKWIIKKLEDM